MANPKEKTPMCLVNELARFNRIQPQYKLLNERGPAHAKVRSWQIKVVNISIRCFCMLRLTKYTLCWSMCSLITPNESKSYHMGSRGMLSLPGIMSSSLCVSVPDLHSAADAWGAGVGGRGHQH